MYLLCGKQIALFNDYSLNGLYETKHAEKY